MTVRPRSLHSYIEKSDYIKSRRPSPYVSLRDLPKEYQDTQGKRERYLEMAIMASMKLSSVGFTEEFYFDVSPEGKYYATWQSMKEHYKWPSDPLKGVDVVDKWYSALSNDEKNQVDMAIEGIDQRKLAKNSAGPEENPTKGPEEQSVPAGESSTESATQTAI